MAFLGTVLVSVVLWNSGADVTYGEQALYVVYPATTALVPLVRSRIAFIAVCSAVGTLGLVLGAGATYAGLHYYWPAAALLLIAPTGAPGATPWRIRRAVSAAALYARQTVTPRRIRRAVIAAVLIGGYAAFLMATLP